MSRMTVFQLGVIVFAICLTTQVVSQNNSTGMANNSSSNPNTTTMATGTFSSSVNATTNATGAGVSLHAGPFPVVAPFILAASLLHSYC